MNYVFKYLVFFFKTSNTRTTMRKKRIVNVYYVKICSLLLSKKMNVNEIVKV